MAPFFPDTRRPIYVTMVGVIIYCSLVFLGVCLFIFSSLFYALSLPLCLYAILSFCCSVLINLWHIRPIVLICCSLCLCVCVFMSLVAWNKITDWLIWLIWLIRELALVQSGFLLTGDMIDSLTIRMEVARAERQIGDSRNKNWSTFLKEPSKYRIKIRLFIRTVKSTFEILDSDAGLKVNNWGG